MPRSERRLESGDRFEFNANPTGERLALPFEIAKGVVIPAGSHHWMRYRFEAGFAPKRRLSGQATWWTGGFYTGRLDELVLTGAWKPSPLFIVELNSTRNVGRLPEGNFTQDLVGTRVRVNVSSNLQLNSYLQYDNSSDSFGANTRLRWTFAPLGDLFVVYNHNLRHDIDPETGRPIDMGLVTDPYLVLELALGVRVEPVAGEGAVRGAVLSGVHPPRHDQTAERPGAV